MDKVIEVLVEKINSMAQHVSTANRRAIAAKQGLEALQRQQQQRQAQGSEQELSLAGRHPGGNGR